MNGGVFLFDPSEATFAELLEFATHTSKYRSREAEQGLLNAFFGPSGCCLSHAWNTQKTLSIHYPELFDLTAIRLLHFVGEKPWSSWASPATRALLPAEEQRRRVGHRRLFGLARSMAGDLSAAAGAGGTADALRGGNGGRGRASKQLRTCQRKVISCPARYGLRA